MDWGSSVRAGALLPTPAVGPGRNQRNAPVSVVMLRRTSAAVGLRLSIEPLFPWAVVKLLLRRVGRPSTCRQGLCRGSRHHYVCVPDWKSSDVSTLPYARPNYRLATTCSGRVDHACGAPCLIKTWC
jgi:hypothetical protein